MSYYSHILSYNFYTLSYLCIRVVSQLYLVSISVPHRLEPLNADNYVLLLNWYAGSAKSHLVDKLRETIFRDMGLKPKKAYTWTLFKNKVHVSGTGDVSHPGTGRIYSELEFH